jgi:hypothetical protein
MMARRRYEGNETDSNRIQGESGAARAKKSDMLRDGSDNLSGTNMPKAESGANFFNWQNQIDWSGVIAGVLVAMAAGIVLNSASAFTGFGVAGAASVSGLKSIVTGIGVWMVVTTLVSTFLGAYVAARQSGLRFSEDGLMCGLYVWSIAMVAFLFLNSLGIGGLLGSMSTAVSALKGVVPSGGAISIDDVATASNVAVVLSRYFFFGALLSLGSSMFGGWLASNKSGMTGISRHDERDLGIII